jgi:hypothetical protein
MGRAFSVSFQFGDIPCAAHVSVKDEGYDLMLLVRFRNKEIARILPERKMILSLINGPQGIDLSDPQANELAITISEAISKYMQANEALMEDNTMLR